MTTIPDDVMREAAKHVECYAEPRGCIHVDDDGCGDECAVKIMVSNAILAERERCATNLFDREAFMTAVSGDGDPYVKVQFKTLKEMQSFHRELCKLAAIRSQS